MNNKNRMPQKSKLNKFFTETLKHNWLYFLLSLLSGVMLVLLISL